MAEFNETGAEVRAVSYFASTVTLRASNNSLGHDEPWVVITIKHRDHADEKPMYGEAVFTASEWKALVDATVTANRAEGDDG